MTRAPIPQKSGILAVVLAGGQSRRMGGTPKAWLDFSGQPLIQRVIARLAPQVTELVVSANDQQERWQSLPYEIVPDTVASRPGPLAGLLAGLQCAETRPDVTHVLSAPCDLPFLPQDLLARLRGADPQRDHVRIASSRDRHHPTVGLWPVHAVTEVADALEAGRYRMFDLVERLGAVNVTFPDVLVGSMPVDPFFNVNTPDDLDAARRWAVAAESPAP
ncbi:MAG: molybdenum cofactor guanylyltransferase MobA [Pseudomonadota bacterium]